MPLVIGAKVGLAALYLTGAFNVGHAVGWFEACVNVLFVQVAGHLHVRCRAIIGGTYYLSDFLCAHVHLLSLV